jgi:NAD(P)H-dependent FMN reductase
MGFGASIEQAAEHILGAAGHGGASEDIFGRCLFGKAIGGDDADFFFGDLFVADDAADAAEMIAVAVAEQHGADGAFAGFRLGCIGEEFPTGGGGFFGDEGIDDDPAGFAANNRHHRDIIAAYLPDFVGDDFEQAVDRVQAGLSPQRWVDGGGGCGVAEEFIGAAIPDDFAVFGGDQAIGDFRDFAAFGIFEIAVIRDLGQAQGEFGVFLAGIGAGFILRGGRCGGGGSGEAECEQRGYGDTQDYPSQDILREIARRWRAWQGGTMQEKRLLIIWHSRTGASEVLARAALAGADGRADLLRAEDVMAEAMLAAAGYLFVGPENLGALSGAMKEMLDRLYYPCLGKIEGRAFASITAAGSDGTGAVRQLERIVTGWRLKRVAEAVIVNLAATSEAEILAAKTVPQERLAEARELGAAMAEALAAGIF